MSKAAPGPYETIDIGAIGGGFHTYLVDCNGRKIGVAWGPKEEKVWTAALWAVAPELLDALQVAAPVLALVKDLPMRTEEKILVTGALDIVRAAIAKATVGVQ